MKIRIELSYEEKKALKALVNKTAMSMEVEELIKDSQKAIDTINEKLDNSVIKHFSPDFAYEVDNRFPGIDLNAMISEKYVVGFITACKKLVSPVISMAKWMEKFIKKDYPAFMEEMEANEVPYMEFGRSKNVDAMYIGKGIDILMIKYIDTTKFNHIYLDNIKEYPSSVVGALDSLDIQKHFGYPTIQDAWDNYFSITEEIEPEKEQTLV